MTPGARRMRTRRGGGGGRGEGWVSGGGGAAEPPRGHMAAGMGPARGGARGGGGASTSGPRAGRPCSRLPQLPGAVRSAAVVAGGLVLPHRRRMRVAAARDDAGAAVPAQLLRFLRRAHVSPAVMVSRATTASAHFTQYAYLPAVSARPMVALPCSPL